MTDFDAHAQNYEELLNDGLAVSGERGDFFLEGRVSWLKTRLKGLGVRVQHVLDYGCGTGMAAPVLRRELGVRSIRGIDASAAEIAVARRNNPDDHFFASTESIPAAEHDLVYCNGVFHHIPPAERSGVVRAIHAAIRPGGLFALWENNPWNPGTRLVMSRIPFDRDAVTLSGPESCRMLRSGGFEIVHHDFLFIFPRALRALRRFEPYLSRYPIGAQYLVLGRKV